MNSRNAVISLVVFIVVAALVGSAGCEDARPSPLAPTSTETGQTASIPTALRIAGNTRLNAVGETSQLTVTATWPSGTTTDVSNDARWLTEDESLIRMSPSGMMTAVGLGSVGVSASYKTRASSVRAIVTPPGTFVVFGEVREPGSSRVSGVRVFEPQSGQSMMTRADGSFSVGGLTSRRLEFAKDGFEPGHFDATPNDWSAVRMQTVIRVDVGASVTPTIAPRDMTYPVSDDARCYPCKLIRITSHAPGTIRVRVAWSAAYATLNLWADGRSVQGAGQGPSEIVTDVAVTASEVLLYIGIALPPGGESTNPVPFTLTTTRIPSNP